MRKIMMVMLVAATVLLAGCAHRRQQVIIDPNGVDMGQYQVDLAQCRQIASQVPGRAGKGAVAGAVVGGAIGAVVGTAKKGASVGAITGLLRGARATKIERRRVVKNCMRGRGYRVLN